MQKLVEIYHNEGIDMLKLGFIPPNLAKIGLHKATTARFNTFTERDRDLLEKIHEDMVGGPSVVFKKETVLDETFHRDSTNWCKSVVANHASQLYTFSMCQAMPISLYTRWKLVSESANLNRAKTTRRALKNWSCHTFSESDHTVKGIVSIRQVYRKKLLHTVLMANTVFEAVGCYFHYCPCQ